MYHDSAESQDRSTSHKRDKRKALHTLELPFGYVEEGETKAALVKVVLCDRCVKKIMWKREREKEAAAATTGNRKNLDEDGRAKPEDLEGIAENLEDYPKTRKPSHHRERKLDHRQNYDEPRRIRRSRSRSPVRRSNSSTHR
jgi:protein FRA10AC1